MAAVVYVLALLTSLACGVLLLRGHARTRQRLLLWSGLCFLGLAASNLIVRTGKPILAVPQAAKGFAANGRAIVAWDGSAQADAALRAALPLLKLATHVTVLEIGDGSIQAPAEGRTKFSLPVCSMTTAC